MYGLAGVLQQLKLIQELENEAAMLCMMVCVVVHMTISVANRISVIYINNLSNSTCHNTYKPYALFALTTGYIGYSCCTYVA